MGFASRAAAKVMQLGLDHLKRSDALSHFLKAALIVANCVDSVGNVVQELKS